MTEPRVEGHSSAAGSKGDRPEPRFSLSPRAAATPTLIGLNLAVFVGLWADGLPLAGSTPMDRLVAWGGNFGPLTLSGEWWRLVTCSFVHSSLDHFALNMIGLWFGGNLVERRVGSANFLVIYLASTALGSLASLSVRPEIVGHGASAAVLGVYGALLALSLGRPQASGERGGVSDLFLSAILIGTTLGLGFLDDSIDNPGHLGGLATGLAYGAALRESAHGKRLPWRITAVTAATLVLLFTVAASLPRRIIIIDAEVRRYTMTSRFLLDRFEAARFSRDGDGLPVAEFRELLEAEILPFARESRSRLENLGDVPDPYRKHIDGLLEDGQAREEQWEVLASEFGQLEDTLERIDQIEKEIAQSYREIQRGLEARSLSRDRASVLLFDATVDPWNSLISGLSDNAGLRPAVRRRMDALREYSDLRQQAWALYAESVREDDPGRAAIANEDHRRATEMLRNWTD